MTDRATTNAARAGDYVRVTRPDGSEMEGKLDWDRFYLNTILVRPGIEAYIIQSDDQVERKVYRS